ncbi:MAG: class I SAM-dependent methyltransferase [Pseudomonadota bacterium]
MSDPETLNVYAQRAEEYAGLVGDELESDPLLAAFVAALPPGAEVLDLGCGPGHAASAMAGSGLRVTATDAVPEFVAMAGAHAGVTAQLAAFDDIAGGDVFDGIWANFSLLHADRADMPRHLSALHTALKPGGLFHIALKSGTGAKRDSIGRLYTYYTEAELTQMVTTAGFTVTGAARGTTMGMDGLPADWIALSAHG